MYSNPWPDEKCFLALEAQAARKAGTEMHDGDTVPRHLKKGATGAQVPLHNSIIGRFRDPEERWNDGLCSTCRSQRAETRAAVPFHYRVVGNFTVDNDPLETTLLQLFVYPGSSEWFSIISAIDFEVNVVAAQKQA